MQVCSAPLLHLHANLRPPCQSASMAVHRSLNTAHNCVTCAPSLRLTLQGPSDAPARTRLMECTVADSCTFCMRELRKALLCRWTDGRRRYEKEWGGRSFASKEQRRPNPLFTQPSNDGQLLKVPTQSSRKGAPRVHIVTKISIIPAWNGVAVQSALMSASACTACAVMQLRSVWHAPGPHLG